MRDMDMGENAHEDGDEPARRERSHSGNHLSDDGAYRRPRHHGPGQQYPPGYRHNSGYSSRLINRQYFSIFNFLTSVFSFKYSGDLISPINRQRVLGKLSTTRGSAKIKALVSVKGDVKPRELSRTFISGAMPNFSRIKLCL